MADEFALNVLEPKGLSNDSEDEVPYPVHPGAGPSVLAIHSVGRRARARYAIIRATAFRQSNRRIFCDGRTRVRSCAVRIHRPRKFATGRARMVAAAISGDSCGRVARIAAISLYART